MIDLADPRSQRALLLAADAGQWIRLRTAAGEVAWGIPSCRVPDRYYVATATSCDCEDSRRHGLNRVRIGEAGPHFLCKHSRAIALFEALQQALAETECQATVRQRRHLHVVGGLQP